MRISKKTIFYSFLIALIFFALLTTKIPFYIYKPGSVDELSEMVEVTDGSSSEGDFHLVTVSGGQATPVEYVIAMFSRYREVTPLSEVRPEGFTEEQYRRHQLRLMENSHNSSKVVAYRAANKKVDIEYNGVYVINTIENMPAEQIVQMGDKILQVDDVIVEKANDLIQYVQTKNVNETVQLLIERDGSKRTETIAVAPFPNDDTKVGIGIQLVTDEKVIVEPPAIIKSGNIGGPSAGLMFALELYDQLIGEDITKGYKIAGTGEIDYDGNVLRIGGVDKKVVAAHRDGMDLFFVPYEAGKEDSNYEVAKEVAEQLKTDMKIVPIDTFTEALEFLNQLEPKN